MAKELTWNVVVDDVTYYVKMVGNKISVNNSEPIKYTKLAKAIGQGKGANYEVPVGSKFAILRISSYSGPVLTLDGKDCSTGEVYQEQKAPWWVWIFVILHAVSFFVLLGGAIGGAIQGAVFVLLMGVASQKNKNTGVRIAICSTILAISFIAQYIFAYFWITTFGI